MYELNLHKNNIIWVAFLECSVYWLAGSFSSGSWNNSHSDNTTVKPKSRPPARPILTRRSAAGHHLTSPARQTSENATDGRCWPGFFRDASQRKLVINFLSIDWANMAYEWWARRSCGDKRHNWTQSCGVCGNCAASSQPAAASATATVSATACEWALHVRDALDAMTTRSPWAIIKFSEWGNWVERLDAKQWLRSTYRFDCVRLIRAL